MRFRNKATRVRLHNMSELELTCAAVAFRASYIQVQHRPTGGREPPFQIDRNAVIRKPAYDQRPTARRPGQRGGYEQQEGVRRA